VIGPFIVDFVCLKARLVIEVDGPIHLTTRRRDAIRDDGLRMLGFEVLRFTNQELEADLDDVLHRICSVLMQRTAPPTSALSLAEAGAGAVRAQFTSTTAMASDTPRSSEPPSPALRGKAGMGVETVTPVEPTGQHHA